MLTINASSLRAPPGDALAHVAGHASATSPIADAAGFASLLRQTQAAPAAPPAPAAATPAESPPTPRQTATADAAPNEADAPKESNDPAQRSRALLKAKLRVTERPLPAPRDTPAKPDLEAAAETRASDAPAERCDAPQTQAVAGEPVLGPALMHWLAGVQRAAPAATDDAPARADNGHGTDDADTPINDTLGTPQGQKAADLKADTDLKDKATQAKALRADAAGAREFAGVLAEQRVVEKPARARFDAVDRTRETAGIAAGALAPAASNGSAVAAPVGVPIPTPLGAPDFAAALGLRLAVLAKDGVQSAELHLNPADMGPVSVQIVMDGTQARVDFGADMAATRRAIEAGLPELASALADAGFTLAGGGVSQHARGRGDGGNADSQTADGRRTRALAAEDDAQQRVTAAARRVVTKGGVDLFA